MKQLFTLALFSLVIFSGPLLAVEKIPLVISLEKMQLSYLDGIGEIYLDQMRFENEKFKFVGLDKKYDLVKEAQVFHLQNSENHFSLGPYSGRSLESLGFIDLKDFSFFYREGLRLAFHTYHLHLEIGDGIQQVEKMQWDCQAKTAHAFWPMVCLESLQAQIKQVRIAEQSSKSVEGFVEFLMQKQGLTNQTYTQFLNSPKKIENIFIKILAGETFIQLQAKYLFNWTLKVEGQTTLNEKQDKIVLHVTKAKVGFISVRGKVLEMIEKAGLKNVKRQGNEIHFYL